MFKSIEIGFQDESRSQVTTTLLLSIVSPLFHLSIQIDSDNIMQKRLNNANSFLTFRPSILGAHFIRIP